MSQINRFHILLLISSVFHGVLIFSLHWQSEDPPPPSTTLDITLAQFASDLVPEDADFLAQANQQGSGTLEKKAELSTLDHADFQANEIQEVQRAKQVAQQTDAQSGLNLVTSVQKSWSTNTQDAKNQTASEQNSQQQEFETQVSAEIATLEAELRNERQAYAKRPRRRQLTAVATKASADAAYLNAWRQKIESVGNMNYPDLQVYGELTLLVSVRANGTIERVEVRRSSGYRSLDEAARRIVRQAAPFDPFPEAIRKQTDILEIIRTWRFEQEGYLSSSR